MEIIISCLIGIAIGFFVPTIIGKIIDYNEEQKNVKKKRFCHHCHYAYLSNTHEDYMYCPQCGKPLEYLSNDPEIQERLNPFDEFPTNKDED